MKVSRTGERLPSRAATCDIKVFTSPVTGYREIGAIDITYDAPNTLDRFAEAVRPKVCDLGGDAVVAWANGHGFYIKGTVLKSTSSGDGGTVAPAGGAGGCQYDTQCKGDRICVKGECTSP